MKYVRMKKVAQKKHARRLNIYFRQTQHELKGARQAQVYAKVRRNIPYSVLHFSKEKFLKVKSAFANVLHKPFRFGIIRQGERQKKSGVSTSRGRREVGKKMG